MNRARFHFALTPFVVALLGAAPIALFGCDDDANTTTDSGTHDGGTDGEVITHDGGDEDASITKYAVGGTVTGLEGTLTLTAGDDAELTLTDNGSFAFDDALADGTSYEITIGSAPGVQTCTLENGTGTVDGADVTDIAVVCEDLLFFSATDGILGVELWVTDGTTAGTRLVADIVEGSGDSYPYQFKNVGGYVYFSAEDATHDRELWRTDGTEAGTTRVADLRANGSSYPDGMVAVGDKLVVRAYLNDSQVSLFVYDGTNAPIVLNEGLAVGGPPVAMNGRVYFAADDGQGAGMELWSTDGTVSGTGLVKDIRDGAPSSGPDGLAVLGNSLVFSCDAGEGRELCITDGTENGTHVVKDIRAGSAGSNPTYLVPIAAGVVVFFANDGSGTHVWRSDGTENGTYEITNFSLGNYGQARAAWGLAFFALQEPTYGNELWVTDGTVIGTHVLDVRTGSSGSNPAVFETTGDLLCFRANDGTHGYEPWCTDGTQLGTALVKDINASGDGT
ncbi:MAG: hypothetical protein R3A78_16960, partial [Polyangiales bacterium]